MARNVFTRAAGKTVRNEIEFAAALRLRIRARDIIPSQTLAESVQVVRYSQGHKLSIPFYWAIYVHDGRGAITMPAGRFMVFFREQRDDPRLDGGHPQTKAGRKHLSPAEFQGYLELNRKARAFGLPPIMLVKRTVGRVKPNRFFSTGLRHVAVPSISAEAPDLFSNYVLTQLGKAGLLNVKDEAVVDLG